MQTRSASDSDPRFVLDVQGLGRVLDTLASEGFTVLGPRHDGVAVVLDEIRGVSDLPIGWTDRQDAGRYRLEPRDDGAVFGFVVGPQSWKKYLHPPEQVLFRTRRHGRDVAVEEVAEPPRKLALVGARPCDLEAIAIQDRVFLHGPYPDSRYRSRRGEVFVVAVQCTEPGGTCFCASMGTGPRAREGFDLALTEVGEPGARRFVVEVGSERGRKALARAEAGPAGDADVEAAERAMRVAAARMGRKIDTEGIKGLLESAYESPRWDRIAERCLGCANCTLVCPTCFCTNVEDTTDLTGEVAERRRRWDSCFTQDFAYIHGGSLRTSGASRYRQWMIHKLAAWHDQFGTSGCVGCGRCITWCPVGIDITEEAGALREDRAAGAASGR